jgi:dTDP-4-amino-4,6-dideoxygalactose transaminase
LNTIDIEPLIIQKVPAKFVSHYKIMPLEFRNNLINKLKQNNIMAVFHYQSLHMSPFYSKKHVGEELVNSDYFTDSLLRLPLFFDVLHSLNSIIKTIV